MNARALCFALKASPLALTVLLAVPAALAKNIHVPNDYPTIPQAVLAAKDGDTIHVGPGKWCGALIDKRLDLVGDGGATIIGCPQLDFFGFRTGFFLNNGATTSANGSSVSNFTFDCRGWGASPDSLALGVITHQITVPQVGDRPPDDVSIRGNKFLGCLFGVMMSGSGWSIDHNVFDGITIDPTFGFGGASILLLNNYQVETSNVVSFNKITATLATNDFNFDSWIFPQVVPFVGIAALQQDGLVVVNNSISIGVAPGVSAQTGGVLLGDDSNATIQNNDGRGSTYAVIVDGGNVVNATLRGNFGVNLINDTITSVTNRSIHTRIACDSGGVCH